MADTKQDKPAEARQSGGQEKTESQRRDTEPEQRQARSEDRDLRSRGTTRSQAEELARLGVNPRLDNRTGGQRPSLAVWPAKPQQVPGPEVGHFAEHDQRLRSKHPKWFDKPTPEPAGMRSQGPHGLGEPDA
jgi:hypothetical protein